MASTYKYSEHCTKAQCARKSMANAWFIVGFHVCILYIYIYNNHNNLSIYADRVKRLHILIRGEKKIMHVAVKVHCIIVVRAIVVTTMFIRATASSIVL